MKPSLFLLPLLLAMPAFCAEDSNLLDLLPSDAQVVFGIRVRSVVDSELGRNISTELKGQAADWQKLLDASGFDPLHDLDEVLIASTGAGKKAPTLAVARGTFDVAKLAPNAEQYKGVPLVSGKTTQGQGVFAFLDNSTALAGDLDMVKAAIDRRGEPAHLDSTLGRKVAEYHDHYDVWAVVNRMDGLQGYVPKSNGPADALNSIDRFQFGMSVTKGLELVAEAHARSAKDAQQLASMLQFLDMMTKASPQSPATGTKFSFKSENGTLKVSLSVSEEEMKKAIETQRKGGTLFGLSPAQSRPRLATADPVPPVPSDPVPAPPSYRHAAPGVGPDTDGTAVFSLPGRP